MKLLLLGFILALNINAKALDGDSSDCETCPGATTLHQAPSKDIAATGIIVDLGVSKNISLLSARICAHFVGAGDKIAINVKNTIQEHMRNPLNMKNPTSAQIRNPKSIPNPSKIEMIRFLNKNRNFMVCKPSGRNYMAEAFEHGAYDQLFNVLFFDDLLLDDDSLFVDVNVITYSGPPTGKEPETVLDYMYRESENLKNSKGKRNEIKSLITLFEDDLQAKRYAKLDKKEKVLLLVKNTTK